MIFGIKKQDPFPGPVLFYGYIIWEMVSRILSWQPPQPVEQWVMAWTWSKVFSTSENHFKSRVFSFVFSKSHFCHTKFVIFLLVVKIKIPM